ncbi:hypothetical protein BJ170DRAFT_305758 [Xylariales sp. AK1849]|nr:hypothetical protein BJ170DRAFT_305758 [Xylariales sp. AK1849]
MEVVAEEPRASQVSSHFPLEPISGSTMYEIEVGRREELKRKGSLRTGCREIDEQVLIDGFERGAVVGISAEDVDIGLIIALQTIAHNLVSIPTGRPAKLRAAIITTLPAPALLPTLRDIVKSQVQAVSEQERASTDVQVRQCLERISVSRVFDIEGLWEVLNELESEPTAKSPSREQVVDGLSPMAEQPESSPLSEPPSSPVTALPPLRTERSEILDSEDEGGLSSSPPASPIPPSIQPTIPPTEESRPATPAPQPKTHKEGEGKADTPDVILITHFSTLLNALFTHRDKSSAHTTLQLLSSHLLYLSRSYGSLIILLNGTTNSPSNPSGNFTSNFTGQPGMKNTPDQRPLDSTLRSIFNPPPPSHVGSHDAYGSAGLTLSKRNKPAFGLTFSQFLDLHLLCTQLPRSRADAEALFAPPPSPSARELAKGKARYSWVVEVLLDESRFWMDGVKGVGKGIDREQRWGAVDVKEGIEGSRVGVVDVVEKTAARFNTVPVQLAAGFGGRRV